MDEIREWIQPLLETVGCRLYDVEWLTNENPPLLRISVEKEDGITDLDTCTTCSQLISDCLDEKDWYDKEYNLEVCSPGAERPLKTEEQINQAMNAYVYAKLKDPKQGLSEVYGTLKGNDETSISIEYKEKTRTKTIAIEKTNLREFRTAVKV